MCLLEMGLDPPTEVTQVKPETSETNLTAGGLSPGQLLGNRYEIHSLSGRGGM